MGRVGFFNAFLMNCNFPFLKDLNSALGLILRNFELVIERDGKA